MDGKTDRQRGGERKSGLKGRKEGGKDLPLSANDQPQKEREAEKEESETERKGGRGE